MRGVTTAKHVRTGAVPVGVASPTPPVAKAQVPAASQTPVPTAARAVAVATAGVDAVVPRAGAEGVEVGPRVAAVAPGLPGARHNQKADRLLGVALLRTGTETSRAGCTTWPPLPLPARAGLRAGPLMSIAGDEPRAHPPFPPVTGRTVVGRPPALPLTPEGGPPETVGRRRPLRASPSLPQEGEVGATTREVVPAPPTATRVHLPRVP